MNGDPRAGDERSRILDEAGEWHRVAEERRRQLERLQDEALYQRAASMVGRGRRLTGIALDTVGPIRSMAARLTRSALAAPRRLRSRASEAELRAALAALPPVVDPPVAREDVTAVIVTATQPRRLDALLAALDALGVMTLVVDNAGVAENAGIVARYARARRIPLTTPVTYAQANRIGIDDAVTPWVLLLNDDVLPLDDHWLDRMLAATDDGTAAVGAQLVHGHRGLLGGAAVDGLVQHAGVGLVLDGPLARPTHLGRGTAPHVSDEVVVVPAATAACLLVRTEAYRAVGGMHTGFDYGSEDVDLCLRLAGSGRVRVALGAVLHHEEGATRLVDRKGSGPRERTARQDRNRRLLDARHAPSMRRRVVESALPPAAPAERAEDPKAPAPPRSAATCLVIGVGGTPPRALLRAVGGHPAVRLDTKGSGALTIVTDPAHLPSPDAASAEAPILGWIDRPGRAASWARVALDRLDMLVVESEGASPVDAEVDAIRSLAPTLPIHVVAGPEEARAEVRSLLLAPRWSLRIGAPDGRAAQRWGDLPVAQALRRELRHRGIVVRIVARDRWGEGGDRSADVTVHLKGRGVAPFADAQVNVVWVMSHPSEVAPGELDAADLVLAGSELLAARYRERTGARVEVMPQAADARRFTSGPAEPDRASRVLFVGNTRSVARPSVLGAVDAGLPLTLIGSGWERYVDPALVRSSSVANTQLPGWYRSADVVLNDHWEDMARWGLVSNRVFDVLACGVCVVSDEVPGMSELLDDAVVTFSDREDVGGTVRALLADPGERAARAERGRRAVLAAHTWEHRAGDLVRLVAGLDEARQVDG